MKIQRKKGFTLVELIVAMMLFGILTASATAILVPTLHTFERANDMDELNVLLDDIANTLTNDLRRAAGITVANNGSEATINSYITYSIGTGEDEGLLVRNGRLVYDRRYYKGKTVEIQYRNWQNTAALDGDVNGPFYLRITIRYDTGPAAAGRDYAVRPMGM